jgi:hypothetical protein
MIKGIVFRVKSFFKKLQVIPDIDEKRLVIDEYRNLYGPKTLIETGTFLGDTVAYFLHKFERIVSIELSDELATKAVKRFENNSNVKIIQGNSNVVLPHILTDINEPVLFWLDGHYSSEFFVGSEFIKTAKGEYNTPINDELDIILKVSPKSIILIDDARLFTGENDYPTVNDIKAKIEALNISAKVFVKKDIIHIIPHK